MRVDEIELIGDVEFPKDEAQQRLKPASPYKQFSDDLVVYYYAESNIRMLFLADRDRQPAAIAFFVSTHNDRVWQAKNAASYPPHKGQKLVAQLYRIAKVDFKKSIQSDLEQTTSGMNLWTVSLPSIGLEPRIYDHNEDRVIDPKTQRVNVYPSFDSPEVHRYSWILERNDYYPTQNLIENRLLMPLRGRWSDR